MDCESYKQWLENRDMYDVSEADLAHKHSRECKPCRDLYHRDEQLDQVFARSMATVPLPAKLKGQVDFNLAHCHRSRTRRRLLLKSVPALIAAMLVVYLLFPLSPASVGMEEMGRYALAHHAAFIDAGVEVTSLEGVTDWCRDRVAFKVIPPSLPVDRYRFVGARVCALGECSAVQLRYWQGDTLVSVYILNDQEVDFDIRSGDEHSLGTDGNLVRFWKENSLVYVLVA